MQPFLVIAGIMLGGMLGISDISQAAPRIGIEGTLGKSSLVKSLILSSRRWGNGWWRDLL